MALADIQTPILWGSIGRDRQLVTATVETECRNCSSFLLFSSYLYYNLLYSVFLVLSKNGNMHSFNTLPSGGAFISHPRVSSAVVLCEVVVATL